MTESKELKVSIRFNNEEKELLTTECGKLGMSLSQYIRYKMLEEDKVCDDGQKSVAEYLEKHMTKLSRMMIDAYYNIKALAVKELSDEEIDEIVELVHEEFDTMEIAKGKERYGVRTIKTNDQNYKDEEKA